MSYRMSDAAPLYGLIILVLALAVPVIVAVILIVR